MLSAILGVPDAVHRKLKARAAAAGMALSDFLLAEIAYIARRPTTEELLERIAARGAVSPRASAARALRAEREARR